MSRREFKNLTLLRYLFFLFQLQAIQKLKSFFFVKDKLFLDNFD